MTLHAALRHVGVTLMAVVLTSCLPPAMPHPGAPQEINKAETIIVARVEFVPPLEEGAQRLSFSLEHYRDLIMLLIDEELRPIGSIPDRADYEDRMELTFEETGYFVTSRKEPFFLLAGLVVMTDRPTIRYLVLPGGFRVDIHPGDEAIYLGTIRYHRDEFSGITKVEIIDAFEQSAKSFTETFGVSRKLEKRLLSLP